MTGRQRGVRIDRRPRRGTTIFDSVSSSPLDDTYSSGVIPGCGTYFCLKCGSQLSLRETDVLPECDNCGTSRFRRDSIFSSLQDHSATTSEFPAHVEAAVPLWLREARAALPHPGSYLVRHDDDGELVLFAIERGWTRIGRSANADLRLDHPSVSRRHALVIAEPGRDLRVLDDRSLNGVFVNGERVEWGRLGDGDELAVGHYCLYALRA